MNNELNRELVGVDWNFSQNIRDNVMEALSGIKGDNSVKIFGPNLDELEALAVEVQNILRSVHGIENVGIFHIKGQTNLEFRVDLEKCKHWGVTAADVEQRHPDGAGGQGAHSMIEGEKIFDVSVRWPKDRRGSEMSILDIPLDIINNTVTPPPSGTTPTPSALGSSVAPPSGIGQPDRHAQSDQPPRRESACATWCRRWARAATPDPKGSFERPGASTIYREQGNRLIAVKFSVRGRDLAGAVAEAQEKASGIVKAPYRVDVERRVRGDGEGRGPADGHHPAVAGADLHPAVHGVPARAGRLFWCWPTCWTCRWAASGRCT